MFWNSLASFKGSQSIVPSNKILSLLIITLVNWFINSGLDRKQPLRKSQWAVSFSLLPLIICACCDVLDKIFPLATWYPPLKENQIIPVEIIGIAHMRPSKDSRYGRHDAQQVKNLNSFSCVLSLLITLFHLSQPRKKATFVVKFTLRSHSKDSWENAVTEAEHLMSLGR